MQENLFRNCKIYKQISFYRSPFFSYCNIPETIKSFIKNNTFFGNDNQEIDFTKYEEKIERLISLKSFDFEIEGFYFIFRNKTF